jgi:hypothetical protein
MLRNELLRKKYLIIILLSISLFHSSSNFAHAIFSLDTCNRPFTLDTGFSFLRWPFSSGSWTVRNSWKGANELGGEGSGWGQGRHTGSRFFAVDWNKVGDNDCDSIFYAPMGGTVIFSYYACSPGCVATGESCRGNEVVIQSNVDTNFAFSVLHLNMVLVPQGRIVKAGDPIGTIGSTGLATTSHAHCVLFKNINRYLTGIQIGIPYPDEHAAPFDFSADCGGDGPHNINFDVITGIPEQDLDSHFSVIYRRSDNSLFIKVRDNQLKKYSIEIFNAIGQKEFASKAKGNIFIPLKESINSFIIIIIQLGQERFTQKISVIGR